MFTKILKNRKEVFFWALAFVLAFLVLVYGIFTIKSLANHLNAALSQELINPPTVVTFDIGKAEELFASKKEERPAEQPGSDIPPP